MADGSNFKSTNMTTHQGASADAPSNTKRLSVVAACLWVGVTILFFATSVWCFKHGVKSLAPYWSLEWFVAIIALILLAAVVASWDSLQSKRSPTKDDKTGKKGQGAVTEPAWVGWRTALSQTPVYELGVGLVVTYGLFLVLEVFEAAEAVEKAPKHGLLEEKSNIIRVLLSSFTEQPPYIYYLILLAIGLFMVCAVPVLRAWFVYLADKKAGEFTESEYVEEHKKILHLEDVNIPATQHDCSLIEAKIAELEATLRDLFAEETRLRQEITVTAIAIGERTASAALVAKEAAAFRAVAAGFGGLSVSAGALSGSLSSQHFVTEGAEPLRVDSVQYLGETVAETESYCDKWLAIAARAEDELSRLEGEISALGITLAALKARLDDVLLDIADVQGQLKVARDFLAFCLIPHPSYTERLPVWGIFHTSTRTRNFEPTSPGAEFFTWAILALLALNIFFIAPAIEMGEGVSTGIASIWWVRFGFILAAIAILPLAQAMRAVKLSLGSAKPKSFWHWDWSRAIVLSLAGSVVAFASMSVLLPPKPIVPPPLPEMVPSQSELKLSCDTIHDVDPLEMTGKPKDPKPKDEKAATWSFGSNSQKDTDSRFDMIAHDLSSCKPAEALGSDTIFVAVVGLASQEGTNRTQEYNRAANRANALATVVDGHRGQWTGPIIELVIGQAKPSPLSDASRYADTKLRHRSQRDIIVIRETETPKPPEKSEAAPKPMLEPGDFENLYERYMLAGEHFSNLVTGRKETSTPVKASIAPDETLAGLMAGRALDKLETMHILDLYSIDKKAVHCVQKPDQNLRFVCTVNDPRQTTTATAKPVARK